MALTNVQLTCHSINSFESCDAVRKKQIEAIQIVAKIAARQYQVDFILPAFDVPRKTIIPDNIVSTETVVSSNVISCNLPPFFNYSIPMRPS